MCKHGKQKAHCRDCSPQNVCEHNVLKFKCRRCKRNKEELKALDTESVGTFGVSSLSPRDEGSNFNIDVFKPPTTLYNDHDDHDDHDDDVGGGGVDDDDNLSEISNDDEVIRDYSSLSSSFFRPTADDFDPDYDHSPGGGGTVKGGGMKISRTIRKFCKKDKRRKQTKYRRKQTN
jgi:hypothetical protein